MSADTALQNWL